LSYRRAPDSGSITDDKDPLGRVLVRCYAELNDYLPEARRQRGLSVPFSAAASIERLIAGLGIPAAAVEVALVNGTSSRLDHGLQAGDRVSLYPLFESFDVTPLLRLRDRPLRRVRFVADAHLGRLARYLRLLGFDTLFENDPGDAELARISAHEGRILLSRDKRLLQRRILTHALWIPAIRPREQLAYLVDRLDLRGLFRPFTRCTLCNGRLVEVKEDVPDLPVPPGIRAVFKTFWRCEGCDRIYWQGSHYDRLRAFVEQLAKPDADPDRG
jgi:hypothetical protein